MMKVSGRVRRLLSFLLVALGAAVGPLPHSARAQAGPPDPSREGGPGMLGGLQAEPGSAAGDIQRMLDGYELMQAHEILQLDDDQFPRFLPRLKALQDARRSVQVQRSRIIRELRRLTQPRTGAPDEARIREQIKALDDLDTRAAVEIRQAREAVDLVLDPRQQARFRIFEELMEQRKVELLMRARQSSRPQNRPPRPPIP